MDRFNISQKIIHRLILQSSFLSDPGLFCGKMGISIFFFEYGRYKENEVYTDFAEELLDYIWKQVHIDLPIGFAFGLSGIGWGLEYLLQNNYLKGDANEICEDIDRKIMQTNILRLDDHSLETGLEGLFYYVSARLQGAYLKNTILPFDSEYMKDLFHVLSSFGIDDLALFYSHYPVSLKKFVNISSVNESTYLKHPLGLNNGISGYLLNSIMQNEETVCHE